jgi:hypothetical protein
MVGTGCVWTVSAATVSNTRNVFPPDASLALSYKFEQGTAGLAANLANPGKGDLYYRSQSAYGAWRGGEVYPDDPRVYPRLVLGRNGLLSALRTGTAGETLGPTNWMPDFEKGYSISAWLRVYDHGENFGGAIFNLGSGYKSGWRLVFTRAHWVKEGCLALVCGTENGSIIIECKPFRPEAWHQVALVASEGGMSLYVDGKLADRTKEKLVMPRASGEWLEDGRNGFRVCGKWFSDAGLLDYRLDELAGFRRPLTADEVKNLYEAGKPDAPDADPSAREASLNALSLEIPKDSWGYFPAGQPIPLTFSAPAGAAVPKQAVLRLADSAGAVLLDKQLDFPSTSPGTLGEEIVIAEPGLYRLSMRLLDRQGRVLKETVYPLGITDGILPRKPVKWLGAENVAMRPEPLGVGVGLNRVVCDWGRLEPARGEYDWSRLDFMLLDPCNEKLDLLVCLTGAPAWLGGDPDAVLDERGASAYRAIWSKLPARYPRVKFWEADDMPDRPPGDWRKRVPRYRQRLGIAAAEIRNRGGAVLGGGSWDASPEWTEAVLAGGGGAAVDVLAIQTHFAEPAGADLVGCLRRIRAVCAASGYPDLPIWNTGLGCHQAAPGIPVPKTWPIPSLEERRAAEAMARSIQAQLAAGVERVVVAPGIAEYQPRLNAADGQPSWKGLAVLGLQKNKE